MGATLLVLTGCGAGVEGELAGPPAGQGVETAAQPVTAQTLTFAPIADATVDASQPTAHLGFESRLFVDGSPERRAYLRFRYGRLEGTVTRAVLRLFAVDPSTDGPAVYATSPVWDEEDITWNTAPPPEGGVLADVGNVPDESFVEYDVTQYVKNGGYTFLLISTSGNGTDFLARHGSDTEHQPRLVITLEPTACVPGSAPRVTTVAPTFDTYVAEAEPSTANGTSSRLVVDADPRRESFLVFDVDTGGRPLQGARMSLYATDGSPERSWLHRLTSAWTGGDFGWSSRPSYEQDPSVLMDPVAVNSWADIPLNANAVAPGRNGYALTMSGANGLVFTSSEGPAAQRPRLLFTTDAPSCSYQGDGIGGTTEWWKGVGGAGQESLRAAASSSTGEPVLAGTYSGAGSTFGGAALPGTRGLALARYRADGTVAWSRGFPAQDVEVAGVAVTPEYGNVLVLGEYDGTLDFGTGALPTDAPGWWKMFIAKFGPTGAPVWSKGFVAWQDVDGVRRPGSVYARSIATDVNGSVVVTGFFQGTLDLGGGSFISSVGQDAGSTFGMFVVKFRWDGVPLWSLAVPGVDGRPTQGWAVTTDENGDVLVGGMVADGTELGPWPPTPPLESRPFVAKYSGATGAMRWSRVLTGATGRVNAVAAAQGNVYFTGAFQGAFNFGVSAYAQSGEMDGLIGAMGADGSDLWLHQFGTPEVMDEGQRLTVSGNAVVLTGYLGARASLGGRPALEGGPFAAAYRSNARFHWARNLGWRNPATGLAPMEDGAVFIGGNVNGPASVDGQTYTPAGPPDLLLLKLRR